LNIYFLGTGTSQGIPVIGSNHPVCKSTDFKDKRLRVSVWITWGESSFIIDCGPDFRQQMLRCNCPKVDGIFFTHEHADHTAGLDDIRPYVFAKGKINIYAHKRVLRNLEKRFDYIFETENKYPGSPEVNPIEVINNHDIKIQNNTITPINAMHGDLQVFGYKFHNFAYLTDIKSIDVAEIKKLQNLDVLVINSLREEPHNTHFSLQEALDFIKIVQPKEAYLTHISHHLGFHEEIQSKLPKNVYIAYDNLTITIN